MAAGPGNGGRLPAGAKAVHEGGVARVQPALRVKYSYPEAWPECKPALEVIYSYLGARMSQ